MELLWGVPIVCVTARKDRLAHTHGAGGQTEHRITVRPFLPILTPRQAATFPLRLANYRDTFLRAVRGFKVAEWCKHTGIAFVGVE